MASHSFYDLDDRCSIRRTLDVIGEKWTLLVLREAFYGATRFADFHGTLGCARNLLTTRLKTLTDEGILSREPYQEPGARARDEYHLTGKGLELFPVLLALMQWGDRWTADPSGPSVEVVHRDCGLPVTAQARCADHRRPITVQDIEIRPGR